MPVLNFFVWFALLLTAACAGRTKDSSLPLYHTTPPVNSATNDSKEPPAARGADAGLALALALIDLSIRKGSDETLITGECRFRSEANIGVSCHNTVVTLQDLRGKEVGRTQADQGRFQFRVKKGARYRVQVDIPNYDTASKDVVGGDSVIIELNRGLARP